ncbi:hypothetical protein DFQ29_003064 [Apophysomyces sp. BC1021]|nr:hypothetical protein DFQ29_003064 [Apophysomyces sp. BC1021]
MSISPVSNSTCNIKSREYYRRTAKELTTRAPSPYGIIPKRKKRTRSTIALSDILCEHYVQQTVMMMDESEGAGDGDDDGLVDVPLATFRMFEAPPSLDEDEQSFIWQSPDREWIPVDCCPKQEPRKSPATTRTLRPPSKRYIPIRAESPVHIRDTRSNAAHLRMLVAEVNMMRAHKIVGPLRPRGYLNKRLDRFVPHRPSRLCEVAA